VLARLFFDDDDPDETTLGQATWLYGDLVDAIASAVQKGIVQAFPKK